MRDNPAFCVVKKVKRFDVEYTEDGKRDCTYFYDYAICYETPQGQRTVMLVAEEKRIADTVCAILNTLNTVTDIDDFFTVFTGGTDEREKQED
jgi:hypothetical protein